MSTKKITFLGAFRSTLKFGAYILLISILLVALYKFVNPRYTPLMMLRVAEQINNSEKPSLQRDWVKLSSVSYNMKLALIAAEDDLFLKHRGINVEAMSKAYKRNKTSKKIRGGSTITQQTAKNVFLVPAKTYFRKGLELYFSGLIEVIWGKQRILEVYVNVIETGKGIYGVEKAAKINFNKSVSKITNSEAALIAAVLPNPNRWSPKKPTQYILNRKNIILKNMNNIGKIDI